jgi:hypothetical protein
LFVYKNKFFKREGFLIMKRWFLSSLVYLIVAILIVTGLIGITILFQNIANGPALKEYYALTALTKIVEVGEANRAARDWRVLVNDEDVQDKQLALADLQSIDNGSYLNIYIKSPDTPQAMEQDLGLVKPQEENFLGQFKKVIPFWLIIYYIAWIILFADNHFILNFLIKKIVWVAKKTKAFFLRKKHLE